MLVPSFLHGRYSEVKKAMNRKVTQLKRGAAWADLAGDLVDTRELPGLMVLDGPSRLILGEHFHFFVPGRVLHSAIHNRLPDHSYVTLFEPVAATNWGFLTMLGQCGQAFLFPPGHQQHFLHVALHWWGELLAEGPRYSNGSDLGESLWKVFTNVRWALAREGLPRGRFQEPTEGGLAELVAQTRAGLPPSRHHRH